MVSDLAQLPHLNMWSADFVIQTGGWVYVWNDAGPPEFHCEHHWIDDGSIWTAMCRQFRKPCDLPRNRAWVPVPCLNDGGCHFVRATDPGEARVLMHDPSGVPGDEATECRLLLDTDGPRRVPLGWRLRPDVEQREQNGGFRDGDVFVPTRSGASPSLLGLLVGARLPVGLRLFLFGFCICSWSTAMVAPSLEQQTILPTPVGKYPWRVPYDIRAMHEAVLPGTRAAPLSPFSPHDEPCELTPDTLADDIYVSLSSHEPVWYHEVAPVWPALGIHRLTFVPVPPCPELVCVVVVSADWQLPVLIPKRADINWVLSHVRRHTPGAVVALRGPVGASARHRSDSDAVDWRNGDVLLAIEWHAAGRSLEVPTFLSLEHVRHSGLWMMDFQTACVVQLIIWRPGRPPVTTDMPADASWDATRQCFRGRFETKYPGAWAPVPWAYSNAVNLCQRSQDPTLCNVLVEVVSLVGQDYQLEPTCHTVHQASSRHSIAGALQLPTTDLRLIGIAEPSDDFPALRDGDVIHYRSPLDSRSRPFGNRVVLAGLLSYRLRPVLAPALFFLVGLSHVASASPSPGYDDHWLWSPYQGRLGPVHLQDGSAPDAAFTALEPIWSRGFIQVVPRPEHRRVWVPRPLSSTLVSVLLFGPPSAVAQMLPPVLSRALLLRIMRHFFGEVLAVAGRRFGLRSLEPAERLVPLNDGDLLVAIMETWVPSIQFGWPTQFQSIAAARERGLWSHALTFQGRGWAFLWYDGRTQPVTVPLRGMQTWDPSVCVLRPAFNHLTEGWWPRLHHRESCDSHIHFVPAHSLEAQGCRHRLSDADVSADTASAPAVLEFRDQHSRVPSGRRPNSFLATWQAVQARCSTHFRHVHSHVGILVNTFADALADHASRATHTAPAMFQPLDALRTLIEREGPWTWLIPRAVLRNGVPVYQVQVDTALELPREEPAEDIPQDSSAPAPTPVMPLHVITANVQSLKDAACNPFNPSGHAARRQYFYDQLHRHEVDIVCLQETRSKAGRWATAGVLTWRSGALKGQYGCEVWIRPEIVRPALTLLDFRIVVSQPRLLLVTSINPRFPVSVCTAHAPHSDRPDSEAETFWRELREALNRAPISRGLVVGLDANGDFTSADFAGCLIGSHLADSEPARNDMCLLDLCLQHGLEAPATFPNVQVGPRWSWEHSGGRQKRLDHLLFRPGPWAHSLASQALDFDLATANRDHVALRVRTALHAPRKVMPQGRQRRCTASEIASHGEKFWASIRTGADAKSACCPGRQVARFLRCFTTWRRGLPPKPPVVPCQPYISDRTRGVLETLRDWRAQLRHVKQQANDILCLCWFRRWARRGSPAHASTHAHCLRLHIAAIEHQVHQIGRTAHTLGREDKFAHFSSLTERASAEWHRHGRPLEAITHLKWASRRSAERRAVHAAGGYQIDDALEEQFRAQEGAQRVSHTQLSSIAQEWWQRPAPPCPAAIPTLLQVEAAARSQAGGKAPGPDQVPNEIWSRHPVYTGQWLWPLCLSIGLSGREPFHFKRAIVCALYKKGPASLPENYRSIALLNGIAKLWHGHLRRSIGGSILGRYDPLQLGGRSGVPVSFAVAACRAASDLYSVQGRCEATLYVDIQAAYYEASRALLFHGDSQLSAPPEQHLQHLASLTQLLVSEGALQILGVAPEEIALLQDCVSASHWSLSGSTNIYLATRGSRPGDGLAVCLALFLR